MKKVFIIHGFEASPNGGWRPWLMAELEKEDIYACALPMPTPDKPVCGEWVQEISRHVEASRGDDVYLVGHSLGVPAILRYLEQTNAIPIAGAVLVSGRASKHPSGKFDAFLARKFDFTTIQRNCPKLAVIHGDNDPNVPLESAQEMARDLKCTMITIHNGGHLNGSSGWLKLPQCLEALHEMMR